MSKDKLRPIIMSDELWEMAKVKSEILFGFENRAGYVRNLIKKDKPTRL